MTSFRVLLVEADTADASFLHGALAEIEEDRHWENWVEIDVLHATLLAEALDLIRSESIDVVLLALDLSERPAVEAFAALQARAPHVPIVLLARQCDESLCLRLLRDGAQDFVLKQELDCAPLAHAIQASVQRHRILVAARSGSYFDSLTGVPNRTGFLAFAGRDCRLAELLGKELLLMVAEPEHFDELMATYGPQRRDLALLEAADRLRRLLGPADLLGRLAEKQFGILTLETGAEALRDGASLARIATGAAVFDPAHPITVELLVEHAERDLASLRAPLARAMRK